MTLTSGPFCSALALTSTLGLMACSANDDAPGTGSGGMSSPMGGTDGGGGAAVKTGGVAGLTATTGGSGFEGSAGTGGATLPGSGGTRPGSGGTSASGGEQAGSGGSGGGTAGSGTREPNPVCPYQGGKSPQGKNWVNGDMLEFNDNGGWCWYQDERVIVDQEKGQLIIGSVASGGSRDKLVEIAHWDLAQKTRAIHPLKAMSYTDDHDVAAIVKRPEGGYAAMWAGHNDDCNSYFSVYDGSAWSEAAAFAWPQCPTASGKKITYANLWYLGDTLYSYVRSIDTSPHYLFSQDGGKSWKLGGRLTSTERVGYVAGYYKFWGNNRDRIDFLGTEAHPRDNDNSLYHGYIKDGKIHNSTGQVIDEDFQDNAAKDITAYAKVLGTGATVGGAKLAHLWNADLVRYEDGTVAAIGSGRLAGSNTDDPDKRLLYFRFDGTTWKSTHLARAGTKLYSSEQDYTGLGALDPDNPQVIYISTPYDPRTDQGEFTGKKEIWKGVTCDNGATFDWEPVTANSEMDNLRPIVPKWDTSHAALLWLRGTYQTAQSHRLKVVGLIEGADQ